MKWAADWWGIEILAETQDDVKFLNEFIDRIDPEAARSCGPGGRNKIETDTSSEIMEKDSPMVLTFYRGD